MRAQLDLPLFPFSQCGRSSAPCALTIQSSAIVCSVCGCCPCPCSLADAREQLMLQATPISLITPAPDAGDVHVLHRDFETRSRAILKTSGVHRYATDPTTEVLCCAYAADDEPVHLWTPSDPIPPEVIEAAHNPAWIVVAHNDAFETSIEEHILAPRFGWPLAPIERHRCTLAMALAAGLPARLSAVADALELANRKDAAGERLMHQLSKPRRARKDEDATSIYWFDDAERLNRLYAYCKQDVECERELHERLPLLSPAEQAFWKLSTEINARASTLTGLSLRLHAG